MGKTWVERIDNFTVKSLEAFVLRNNPTVLPGSDPGVVYIMSSPAHDIDLYKVGLTRRNVEERSEDLSSSTGVPLPFGVLAYWHVADCSTIEKEVHKLLKPYRVNKRREFFRTSLPVIVSAVERAIADVEDDSSRGAKPT